MKPWMSGQSIFHCLMHPEPIKAQTRLDAHITRNERFQMSILSILLSKRTPYRHRSSRKALGIYLMSMSMQHNELLRLKSMIADSNNSNSESTSSDATIKADQETDLEYCRSFSLRALYSSLDLNSQCTTVYLPMKLE